MTGKVESKESVIEQWYGTAWLMGSAAVRADAFPVVMRYESGEDRTGVDLAFQEPTDLGEYLGRLRLKQRVDLTITANEAKVQVTAYEAAAWVADSLSFGTRRRVGIELSSFTTVPPGIDSGPYRTIIPMRRVFGNDEPLWLEIQYLGNVGSVVGDINTNRGGSISRALRWLRRSYAADDEFVQFSSLAFALEALAPLLPNQTPIAKEGDKRTSKPAKSSTSKKLRHFALSVPGISETGWKLAGTLRNSLFHGGLPENVSSRDKLSAACPIVERAVLQGIKAILRIPDDALPELPALMPGIGHAYLVVQGVVRTKEPSGDETCRKTTVE